MKPSFKVQQKQEEKQAPLTTSSGDAPTSANAAPERSEPQPVSIAAKALATLSLPWSLLIMKATLTSMSWCQVC